MSQVIQSRAGVAAEAERDRAAAAIALAGTVWMWHLYELNVDATDQNRIYLGADTHAMGLLTGAALACCWNPWAPAVRAGAARGLWRALALAALGLLGWMATTMNTSSPWLYHGAFLLVPLLSCVVIYVTMVYGPIAAALVELFPTRIRYSAMSLPYHIGNGWFGGLLPATAFALIAAKGDIYYGLWYPIIFALLTVVIGVIFVPETKDRDIDDEATAT